ncbi:MAG: flagellar biosynthesis protein FlhF [Candidatus Tectomicrobia bacterium]|uniref:Flagellar biosynthesis protein FlhF n=1 Tax=Tectimicrobiota bacterium TaxID=2528274 RepID=A0A932CMI7_UNCTE|nr:flagellar biosynthesis protein FlhF [Candidatus Tectomicrobia bacterium]
MFIKKYEALDMQEALKLVREDLGPQAVILSSRKVRKGKGTFGLFGRPVIEVTAAVDREEPSAWSSSPAGRLSPREEMSPTPPSAPGAYRGARSWPPSPKGTASELEAFGELSGAQDPAEGGRRPGAGSNRSPEETAAFWDAFQRELGRTESGGQDDAPAEPPFPQRGISGLQDRTETDAWKRSSPGSAYPREGRQSFEPREGRQEPNGGGNAHTAVLRQEVAELKETVQFLLEEFMRLGGKSLPPELSTLYQRLISQGVDPKLAWSLMEKAQSELGKVEGALSLRGPVALRKALAEMVSTSGPMRPEEGRQKVVAFVGPTGVGKTTTIAKLAAHYALKEKRKVALVTLDTYRIAAVEQLKIYAKLIGIPLEVTLSAQELRVALASLQDKELILIDTAGRNQNAEVQMTELKAFFPERLPIEIQLVISATTKERDLWEIYRKFALIKIRGMIFTKLDESRTFGGILNQVICSGLPLSYLTTGQKVPEDIEVATGERIADLILRGASILQRAGRESGSPV